MTQEEDKVQKAKLEFMQVHSNRMRKWMDENFAMRDEFAAENTYKFSNLIISLNIGVVGATSFLISNIQSLNWFSKLLSLSLILPLISIIIELKLRNKVIDVNREACNQRGNFIKRIMEEEALPRFLKKHSTFETLEKTVLEIDQLTEKGFQEIRDWIKREEPAIRLKRKCSLILLITTLVGIILIILMESGTLGFLASLMLDGIKSITSFFKNHL